MTPTPPTDSLDHIAKLQGLLEEADDTLRQAYTALERATPRAAEVAWYRQRMWLVRETVATIVAAREAGLLQ